ncbi:MAG: GatB/YqeY domain-containing protein [Acidimicrobiales bacterium]
MLIDTIRADMTQAMKNRDALKLRSLRAIIAAVQEAEVAGPEAKTLTDDEVLKVISAQAKRRVEAAEAFDAGGADDRAANERAEKEVLESYLPAAMTDDELEQLVTSTLAENGWTAKTDMGQAMKAVNAKVAGRADGRAVADLVKAKLQ